MRQTKEAGYLLDRDSGVIDVWWPYQPHAARYTGKIGAEQTDGHLFQLLCRDRRGGAPPLHIHHREDETFYLIAGEITFLLGDQRIDATAGDFVFAPKGVSHAFLVTSDHAEYLTSFSPEGSHSSPRSPRAWSPASRHRLRASRIRRSSPRPPRATESRSLARRRRSTKEGS